ncbi:MAG: cation:proton antiporter, partial [Chthoniobacterales bacterium]
MELQLLIFAVCLFLYALVAGRIARMPLSGPILFVALGWLIGPSNLDWLQAEVGAEELRVLAELTLALVLFSDAACADLKVVRRSFRIPERMLVIGLPLTILAGFGVARLMFPSLGLSECALLAVILAPTDAALGQAVISNPKVPAELREGLDVESGLNDGICVPVLTLFLALATEATGESGPVALGFELFAKQVGIGLAVGLGVTWLCVWGIRLAGSPDRIPPVWRQVLAVGVAFAAFAAGQLLGGSGFIASFCGGLLFGAMNHGHKDALLEAAEGTGNVMSMITWTLFGAVVFGLYLENCGWAAFV